MPRSQGALGPAGRRAPLWFRCRVFARHRRRHPVGRLPAAQGPRRELRIASNNRGEDPARQDRVGRDWSTDLEPGKDAVTLPQSPLPTPLPRSPGQTSPTGLSRPPERLCTRMRCPGGHAGDHLPRTRHDEALLRLGDSGCIQLGEPPTTEGITNRLLGAPCGAPSYRCSPPHSGHAPRREAGTPISGRSSLPCPSS
jgi:hypothetical protein